MTQQTFVPVRYGEGILRPCSPAVEDGGCHSNPPRDNGNYLEEPWYDNYGLVHGCSCGAVPIESFTLHVGHAYVYWGDERGHPYRYDAYSIWRGALIFDTSSIPDGATIVSAILRLTWYTTETLVGLHDIHVVRGVGMHSPIEGSDYAYIGTQTVSRGSAPCRIQVANESFDIELNDLALAEISKTSETKFGLRLSMEKGVSSPWASEQDNSIKCNVWTYIAGKGEYAPRLIVTYGAVSEAGYIWASDEAGEETELHYISEQGIEEAFEGDATGNNGDPGYLWVEGTYLHYIDSNGNERRTEGTKEGATGVTSGQFWIEDAKLRYVDDSGDERYIEGS